MRSKLVRRALVVAALAIAALGGSTSALQANPGDWRGTFADPSVSFPAQPPRLALMAGPLFSVPVGDFFHGFVPAAGVGLGVRYVADDHLALRGVIRRTNLARENVNFLPVPEADQVFLGYADTDADIWRFSLAAEFFAGLNRGLVKHPSLLFCYFGAGLAYSDVTYHGVALADGLDPTMTIGGGLITMLGPRIGFELAGSFDVLVLTSAGDGLPSPYRDQKYAGLLDLSAALVYGISRD